MKNFLNKIIVFCIPVFVFFSIPSLFLYKTGENYKSLDDIILSKQDYLIGYAYNEDNYKYLKCKELQTKSKQSVIGLGSSRMLQFRDKMFTKPFYNAGYTVSSISDFVPFIDTNILNNKPEVLLITLDQWMFNENWDKLSEYNPSNKYYQVGFNKNASIPTLYNVWSDLFKSKYGFEILHNSDKIENTKKIGLNAIVNNKGFRKDGSMYYGEQIYKLIENDSSANDYNYSDTYNRIEKGINRFEYGKKTNEKAFIVLEDLLKYCQEKNIYVIAIIPPFANQINSKLNESKKYSYIEDIFTTSNMIFKKYDFELWDMSNLSKYGSNDKETLDGFHGGEVTYLKMLIHMLENDSKLNNYSSIEQLKLDLTNKKNNYQVY
ncbi:hypothetical protein M0M57_00250 [Flavobacterium azooxidireducens]|uniref:D-alanyl-lipoteichoic acid biosynthesis protein DltD n=1 Tax=Flavobacterium azooxidireducens TaxID=1871076 RepID=A0ABY4KG52_9FLAO|nr:hypothetical protein [Flavobacterium azooxidireducens]UPQ79286.1 hypothetical protein M0M57_00250 [Flavobacterium azooxidireducens]